jgi:hypothetical protein
MALQKIDEMSVSLVDGLSRPLANYSSCYVSSNGLSKELYPTSAHEYVDHLAQANSRVRLLNLRIKRLSSAQYLDQWDTHYEQRLLTSTEQTHNPEATENENTLLQAHREISRSTIEGECQTVASFLDRFHESLSKRLQLLEGFLTKMNVESKSPQPLLLEDRKINDCEVAKVSTPDPPPSESSETGVTNVQAIQKVFYQLTLNEETHTSPILSVIQAEMKKMVSCAENLVAEFVRLIPRRLLLHETILEKARSVGPGPCGLRRRKQKGYELTDRYRQYCINMLENIKRCAQDVINCFNRLFPVAV